MNYMCRQEVCLKIDPTISNTRKNWILCIVIRNSNIRPTSFYTGQPISELSIFLTLSSLTERHWSEQYAGHLSTSSFLLRIRASHHEMITTQVRFLVWDLNSPTFPTYVKKTFFHKSFFIVIWSLLLYIIDCCTIFYFLRVNFTEVI